MWCFSIRPTTLQANTRPPSSCWVIRQPSATADGALVIAEHRRKEVLEDRYGQLQRTRLLKQGDAALSFYARTSAIEEGLNGQ